MGREVLECGADGKSGVRPESPVHVVVDAGDDLVRGAVAFAERGLYLSQPVAAMGDVVAKGGRGVAEHGAVPGEQSRQLSPVGKPPEAAEGSEGVGSKVFQPYPAIQASTQLWASEARTTCQPVIGL